MAQAAANQPLSKDFLRMSTVDSAPNFSKDYLIQLEDPAIVPDAVEAALKTDVVASALQFGVRLTGDPVITVQEVTDSGDVHLVYSAPAVLNDSLN